MLPIWFTLPLENLKYFIGKLKLFFLLTKSKEKKKKTIEGGNIESAIESRPVQPIFVLIGLCKGQMNLGLGLSFNSSSDLQQVIELLRISVFWVSVLCLVSPMIGEVVSTLGFCSVG